MEQHKIFTICRLIAHSSRNVAARVAERFNVSRQAASTWLANLKKAGIVFSTGTGRATAYFLMPLFKKSQSFEREGLSEDNVWRDLCAPVVKDLPGNVRGIWHHGVTEMVNNAIDHSGSDLITVTISKNFLSTECEVCDLGEGIFLKIQRALNLYDAREAILELAKGKFTTDPENHSGEGIFFSSKMFDSFVILSDSLSFVHLGNDRPDVFLSSEEIEKGTRVIMRLDNDSHRTAKEVFEIGRASCRERVL